MWTEESAVLSGIVWLLDFQIKWACSWSFIGNHKYEFRPRLHDTKFNYHFIESILKLQNSVVQIQDFLVCANICTKLLWKKLQKLSFHFPAIWLVTLNKPWNLIGCCVLVKLSHGARVQFRELYSFYFHHSPS